MDKKDIIPDKTKKYYKNDKDVILNILQALTKELIKELTKKPPKNNKKTKRQKTKNERI